MSDISEAEAVLHLKRALGEIEPGDAVPPPLMPVYEPPPKPKVPKTAPAAPAKSGPMVGPAPPPGGVPRVSLLHANPNATPNKPQLGQLGQLGPSGPPGLSAPAMPEPQKAPQMTGMGSQKNQNNKRPLEMPPPGPSGPGPAPPGPQLGFPTPAGLPRAPGPLPGMPPPGFPSMPGLHGLTPPTMPGMGPPPGLTGPPPALDTGPPPDMRGPPPRPGGGGGSTNSGVQAQIAAAMGPGKTQASFELSQSKVPMVIGKAGATLNAIKTYSKAEAFIEQHTPDEDKARMTVVGSATQVEKCKQTVNALVDGTMSAATLFQLAGVPLPPGGAGEASSSDRDRIGGGGHSGGHPGRLDFPGHGPPPMGPPPGLGGPPFGAPPLPPLLGGPPGSLPMAQTTIPGLPENQQMQQNLNDYYARWWSTYANQVNDPSKDKGNMGGVAFDKEALARLAAKASEPEPEEPPPMPEPAPLPPGLAGLGDGLLPFSMPTPSSKGFPSVDLASRATDEVRSLLGGGGFSSPARDDDKADVCVCGNIFESDAMFCRKCGTKRPPKDDDRPPPPDLPSAAVSSSAPPSMPSKVRGFTPMTLKTSDPPRAKKDDDSVQKMLERLQGNVQQNKQAQNLSEEQQVQMQQMRTQMARMRGGPQQASLSQMLEAGAYGGDQIRTRQDVEFEALISRMPSAQSPDDIENLGREILIRFPSFTPQQVTELLQKIDTCAGLQNADFQAELSRMLIPRLKEFNSTQFTALTSTFASWSNDARGDKKKRGGKFAELSKAFFLAASAEMTSRLMEYAPHEINCCLAAFVSVGFSEHKFFASVGRAALARHTSFAPVQLTALLAILSEMRLVHVDLFNASAQFLSTRAKELRPVDVIRVLRSFAKCSVHHHVMCRAIGDEVVMRIRMKSGNFKVEDLCEIAWAFCVLSYYHDDLFRTMFKELERHPTISIDALIQVYEVHLTLDAEHKEEYSRYRMDSDLAQSLQDHYRDYRKDERRCSERQRNDVASVLKSLVDGSVHVNHRTSTGLLVDVAALRKRSSTDGFIHVDLDSAVTIVRSLDQDEASPTAIIIEGPVALRRRILAKHGLRLITVRESEWRELDESKDKRRHLRSLLSSLGDVLE
mmetsp:Transcript_6422/g.11822  ORF Transcript_6422/g.11822 Transcript_6422/m.11822 type:complete len:1115 (+) Transcript_6422:174-3518(+)